MKGVAVQQATPMQTNTITSAMEMVKKRPEIPRGVVAIAIVMLLSLWWMDRVWWCEVGDWLPWSWDVWSPHNSQHLIDPYSLSHVEHGIGLFLLLSAFGIRQLSTSVKTTIVAAVEAVWEVAENTSFMIERYRETTISLDYFGDSILNSLSDYAMCLLGVVIARTVRWQAALAVFVLLEVISVFWIRDSLLLNILMLLVPVDAVRQWQSIG